MIGPERWPESKEHEAFFTENTKLSISNAILRKKDELMAKKKLLSNTGGLKNRQITKNREKFNESRVRGKFEHWRRFCCAKLSINTVDLMKKSHVCTLIFISNSKHNIGISASLEMTRN